MNASVRDSIFSGYPISDFSKLWFDKLASLSDVSLYKTTASFVLVDKRRKIASMAWVGDSPIAYRVDGRSVISLAEEKEFANVTECLSTGHEQFKICMIAYRDTFDFLVASDGLFDELDEEKFDSLFDYFIQKFSDVPYNKRRSILKKDIRNSVYDFNSDDKTMIFSWTINRK